MNTNTRTIDYNNWIATSDGRRKITRTHADTVEQKANSTEATTSFLPSFLAWSLSRTHKYQERERESEWPNGTRVTHSPRTIPACW